jgi:hypothetical protein
MILDISEEGDKKRKIYHHIFLLPFKNLNYFMVQKKNPFLINTFKVRNNSTVGICVKNLAV